MAWLETDAMNERLQFVQDARSDYPLTSVDLCSRYLLTATTSAVTMRLNKSTRVPIS